VSRVIDISRFEGCLMGLALGDALGAPYEGGPTGKLLWMILGKTPEGKMRWTDDTQMALDIGESLVHNQKMNADDIAARFGKSYRWDRGYGSGATRLLKKFRSGTDWRLANKSVFRDGSFGNGSAMRAPVIGMFFLNDEKNLIEMARNSSIITHSHPLGVEGAVLIASATALALQKEKPIEIIECATLNCKLAPYLTRLEIAFQWLKNKETPRKVKKLVQWLNSEKLVFWQLELASKKCKIGTKYLPKSVL